MNSKQIFISYARADDEPFVQRLYTDLIRQNVKLWWDWESMPSRALTFLQEIKDAITDSERLIFVVGPSAVKSEYVQAELNYAHSICKSIIPILRIGDFSLLSSELKRIHTLDFRDNGSYDTQFDRLVKVLREPLRDLGKLFDVPALPQWYIERKQEIAQIKDALLFDVNEPQVASYKSQSIHIFGSPGLGKSTLISALMQSCEVRRRFYDGIVWINLGKEPNLVLLQSSIVENLGLGISLTDNPQINLRILSQPLLNKSILFVFDDVWDHSHLFAFHFMNDINARYITISRKPQIAALVGGTAIELGVLSEEQGIGIFSQYLKNISPEQFNEFVEFYTGLVRLLGGHTLAIQLAGAQLALRGHEFAPQLLQRLSLRLGEKNPFHDLSIPEDERQIGLEASLSFSYDELNEDLKTMFRSLSVFVSTGTFDVESVSGITILNIHDLDSIAEHSFIEDMLDKLVAVGLVVRHPSRRYGLHRIVKSYALSLIKKDTAEWTATFFRFTKFYLKKASEIFIRPPEEWEIFRQDFIQIHEAALINATLLAGTRHYPDIVNVLSNLENTVEEVDELKLTTIMSFAYITVDYVIMRDLGYEGLVWLLAGFVAAEKLGDARGVFRIGQGLAAWYAKRGEFDKSLYYFKYIKESQAHIHEPLWDAHALLTATITFVPVAKVEQAVEMLETVKQLFGDNADAFEKTQILILDTHLQSKLGNYDAALRAGFEAIEISKHINNEYQEAAALNNVGMVFLNIDKYDDALYYINAAYQKVVRVGDKEKMAVALLNISIVYAQKKDFENALAYLEEALKLAFTLNSVVVQAQIHFDGANILWVAGLPQAAIRAMEESRRLRIENNGDVTKINQILEQWYLDIGSAGKG